MRITVKYHLIDDESLRIKCEFLENCEFLIETKDANLIETIDAKITEMAHYQVLTTVVNRNLDRCFIFLEPNLSS